MGGGGEDAIGIAKAVKLAHSETAGRLTPRSWSDINREEEGIISGTLTWSEP